MAILLNFRISQRGPLGLYYHTDFIVISAKVEIEVNIQ